MPTVVDVRRVRSAVFEAAVVSFWREEVRGRGGEGGEEEGIGREVSEEVGSSGGEVGLE